MEKLVHFKADQRLTTRHCGAIAQLGERIVRNDEVVGSIPTSSTKFFDNLQLVIFQFRTNWLAA